MSESSEYKTLLACYDKLVIALKSDPLGIATELIAVNLIPPLDVKKTDAPELAQLLLNKVELVPERYHVIVEVFSRHGWLKDIVTILQTEHGKLENDSVEVHSPSGDVCRTESLSKLILSSRESPKPGAEGRAISDDSFVLELDCPHKQSSLPIPNPVVRFEDLSKSDRKDLFAQMNELTREIRVEFSKLFDQVYESLRKHVEHKRVVLTLTGEGVQLFQGNKKLLGAKNMFDVFNAIQPHCSYFNYDLLKLLVSVHGTPEDKKCLDGYLKSFASYCLAIPCAEEICGSDGSGTDRIKLKFKLEFDRQQLKPNYIKDNIISNIARILKIKPSSLYLHCIKKGCVCLEFLIPPFLFDGMFPLSGEQKVALYREVNITTVQCDQPSLHVDIEKYAKALTEERQVKVAMTESTSSLPSPGYSSLASAAKPTDPQSLMKPPKEFVDLPSKYLYPQKRSQSEAMSSFETDMTSSLASSMYLSRHSSIRHGRHWKHLAEFDDESLFQWPLVEEVLKRDPEWKQFDEEWRHHHSEEFRLIMEREQLCREKDKAKDKRSQKDIELKLNIKQLELDLEFTKRRNALNQQLQRVLELKRDELLQVLKTATDVIKSEIQPRLEDVESEIRWLKERISMEERQASAHEESLSQLSKESQPASSTLPSKLSPLGEEGCHTDTAVLKTKSPIFLSTPAAPSPVTTLYTCPSCGKQYHGDKSVQHSGEERCVSCSHGQQQTESSSISH